MPKRKSPAVVLILLLIFQGFYLVYWGYGFVNDLKRLAGSKARMTEMLFALFAVLLALFFIALSVIVFLPPEIMFETMFRPVLNILTIAAISSLAIYGAMIVTGMGLLARMDAIRSPVIEMALAAALSVLFFLSIPLVQARLNAVIEKRSG